MMQAPIGTEAEGRTGKGCIPPMDRIRKVCGTLLHSSMNVTLTVNTAKPLSYRNHIPAALCLQSVCQRNGWIYKASCQLEDFVSQVSDWDELDQLTDEQYNRMVQDPRFSGKASQCIGENDSYWEAYWETVSRWLVRLWMSI